jgi:dihydrofolate synthase/folylpolyglutamate synthase
MIDKDTMTTQTLHRPNASPAYQAALDYVYSFINYENKMPPSPEHARFNLDRMRFLLHALGDPHLRYPSVVVAGTKGKGSTSAMLEAILRAAGYRTGLFSSPHLHSWRERIQVNRTLITQDDVAAYVERIKPLVAQLQARGQPTVFELTTAIALRCFADAKVDAVVLEVGLGGRYDTVNVVTPRVSVITPLSYEHTNVLGRTLTDIASAKAGIIKPGVPVVTAPQEPEACAVIVAEAAAQNAPLWTAEADGLVLQSPISNPQLPTPNLYPIPITPQTVGLGGAHQLANARVTVGAALLLREQGLQIGDEALAEGLRTVRWPGRFEVVAQQPTIVVDGAMNGASARALQAALATLPHKRRILVLGTSSDKQIDAIVRELVPGTAAVVLTRSYHPRSAAIETLAEHVGPLLDADAKVICTDDVPPALHAAREIAGPDDLICVTGSLFVVAAAREALGIAEEID